MLRHALLVSLCLNIISGTAAFCTEAPAAPLDKPTGETQEHASLINWQPWSDELFEKAKREDKLVILDLEAVWCHWCHVMDGQTYSNPNIARLIDSKFIAVRVDQDSRPDLSNKYEQYGWPATIIFNSKGEELVKRAGYIPPAEMSSLLQAVIKDPTPGPSIKKEAPISYSSSASLPAAKRSELIRKHIAGFDTKNASWSSGQKFLEPDSVEYAMSMAKAGSAEESMMARRTLNAQFALLDPVWGGMYQYSTHDDWFHPHYEKIMQVQGDNLRVYSLASQLFHDSKYLLAAKSIYNYLTSMLMSPEGAFYTSQDADVTPGKHSDTYFRLSDVDRRKQGIPRIDKHIYSRENGWAISGIVPLYEVTGDRRYLQTALKAADWVLANRALPGGGFSHDEKDAAGPYLGDTLYMGRAFLALYEATGNREWLTHAEKAADFIAAHFKQDEAHPGFLTAEARPNEISKPVPLLDENVAVVRFFNLLNRYDNNEQYKLLAQNAMRYLATPAIANKRSVFVAGILLADRELTSDPVHVTVVGFKNDMQAMALHQEALKYPIGYKVVEWYDKNEGPLPSGSTEFPDLPKSAAFGCAFKRCSLPIFEPKQIAQTIDRFAKAPKEDE